jgi:hypothetical protein
MKVFEVIVVVTTPGPNWHSVVEAIRHEINDSPDPPQIVCLLLGPYRGPAERVYAARKGFKVIYER